MRGVRVDVRQRDLVRPPEALQEVPVHLPWGRPPLGAAEDDHGPSRPLRLAATPRLLLDRADLQHRVLQRGGHGLVHAARLVPLDEQRGIAVADEQRLQLLTTDTGQKRGVVDLVAVEVQDRQHRPVPDRVEELVAVPARGERGGFGPPRPPPGAGAWGGGGPNPPRWGGKFLTPPPPPFWGRRGLGGGG